MYKYLKCFCSRLCVLVYGGCILVLFDKLMINFIIKYIFLYYNIKVYFNLFVDVIIILLFWKFVILLYICFCFGVLCNNVINLVYNLFLIICLMSLLYLQCVFNLFNIYLLLILLNNFFVNSLFFRLLKLSVFLRYINNCVIVILLGLIKRLNQLLCM